MKHKSIVILGAVILTLTGQPVFAQDTLFQDIAPEAGIQGDFFDLQSGVAWGDLNNDGYDDLFVARDPENQLFLNNGDSTFLDISESAGIVDEEMVAFGAAWGDFDGDGDLDLFVANLGAEEEGIPSPNRLYRNNGDLTFTEVAEQVGISGLEDGVISGSVSASWADYDNDNDLDLLVSNRFDGPLLYQNQGDGSFEMVSETAGLIIDLEVDESQQPQTGEEEGHEEEIIIGIDHASWGDFDNDGDLDVYFSVSVIDDEDEHGHEEGEEEGEEGEEGEEPIVETQNAFFRNNADGTFTDITNEAGVGDPNFAITHSSLWGDFNNDGFLDLFVLNRGSENLGTLAPSRLYRNNQDGTFTDVADDSGLGLGKFDFAAGWIDMNNDGFLDLNVILHPTHADFDSGEFYEKPQPIFVNNGDGTFSNINEETTQALFETGVTDITHLVGLAWSDFDNDGNLDFAITENEADGPLRLYQNNDMSQNNNWIKIELEQDNMNSYGIGSRVVVSSADLTQTRQFGVGDSGFASQSSIDSHFGLGAFLGPVEARVFWPGGIEEVFVELEVNQIHTLTRGQGQVLSSVQNFYLYD